MPRNWNEDDDEDSAHAETDADADLDDAQIDEASDDDSVDTVPCSNCHRPVYEQAERCPYCREYVSRREARSGQPRWFVWTVVLSLILVLLWIVRRIGRG